MPDTTDPPDPPDPPVEPDPPEPETPETPSTESPETSKTLHDIILESAAEPKSATVDGQTIQARDLREMIEEEKYLAAKKASRRPGCGLHFTKLVPPGSL